MKRNETAALAAFRNKDPRLYFGFPHGEILIMITQKLRWFRTENIPTIIRFRFKSRILALTEAAQS